MEQHTFELTDAHIRLMRHGVVFWDHSEGGAPFIGAYGDSIEDIRADVARLTGSAAQGEGHDAGEQPSRIDQLIRDMGTVLQIAISCGKISTGEYHYTNPLLPFKDTEAEQAVSEIYRDAYGANRNKEIVFELQELHLQLLRRSWVGWLDYAQVAGMHSKYPYGNQAYYQADMAEALGLEPEVSDEQHNELEILHQQMQPALQVLLLYVQISPGRYRLLEEYGHEWDYIGQ